MHYPVLIPLLPLTAALLCVLLSKLHKNLGPVLVILSLLGSLFCAGQMLIIVLHNAGEPVHYWMGNWQPPFGIEFVVDPINAVIVLAISLLAVSASIYSWNYVKALNAFRLSGFYTLLGLLAVGLYGMTLTGDVFNLYVFLEISSLTCYGLIALGGQKGVVAAFRYLLIGTIGASLYLMGIGLLYATTGTLNMADLSERISLHMDSPIVIVGLVCLLGAFAIKMALFPFHGWQPDAYTYAHPGAAPLIAGAMSKVPAYAMLRFFFYVFGGSYLLTVHITTVIGVCGAVAMLYGSFLAIKQTDLRRMFAYSSIAQLGYIALGFGMTDAYGLAGSTFHILIHALMKGSLFLAIGAITYRFGVVHLDQIGQLQKKMPWTVFTIVMASLSMVGIPPTGGFFSKYYLMIGAWQKGLFVYMMVLVLSTLLNAVYFLRLVEKIFIAQEADYIEQQEKTTRFELPLNMLIPIALFGILILAIGILNGTIVGDVLLGSLKGVAF